MQFQPFVLKTILSALLPEDQSSATSPSLTTHQQSPPRLPPRNSSLSPVNLTRSLSASSTSSLFSGKVTAESVETWDKNVYVGTNDGYIYHYLAADLSLSDDEDESPQLIQKRNLGVGKKSVERIVALPTISKLVVLCDSTIMFFTLPDLSSIPHEIMAPIRGVTCLCFDEGNSSFQKNRVSMCAVKRRAVQFYQLGDGAVLERETSLPDGAITVCRFENHLCFADTYSYKILDIRTSRAIDLIPTSKGNSDWGIKNSSASLKPIVTVVDKGEFLLITAAAGAQSALGMFVTSSGDPTRGTLQWPSHPRAIGIHFPYVIALLRNNTIQIHNLLDQKLMQSFGFTRNMEVRNLVETNGMVFSAPSILDMSQSLPSLATTFLITRDSLMTLAPLPLITQVDSLLDTNRVEEALDVAEDARNTIVSRRNERMRYELEYIYRKAGFIYLGETLFDDALGLFLKGNLDPRVLIKLFPDISGPSSESDTPLLEEKLNDYVDGIGNINDIVTNSLQKNYSVNLNTPEDEETIQSIKQMHSVLISNAKEILVRYLVKTRPKSIKEKKFDLKKAIDTALLKLYSESNSEDLYKMLRTKNDCILSECEGILLERKQFYPLALLYVENKEYHKALDLMLKIYDGPDPDTRFGGVAEVAELLSRLADPTLVLEYVPWVIERDPSLGAEVFVRMNPEVTAKFDKAQVLSLLEKNGGEGIRRYLEYLIFQCEDHNTDRHTTLATTYIEDLSGMYEKNLQDVLGELETAFAVASITSPSITFMHFLEKRTDDASNKILEKILEFKYFTIERAILFGRVGEHEKALETLVYDAKDYIGAEVYCIYEGKRVCDSDASGYNQPKSGVEAEVEAEESAIISSIANGPEEISTQSLSEKLFHKLLEVYLNMSKSGNAMLPQITRLLDARFSYLDISEVLQMIPDEWSVDTIHSFLIRSLRKTMNIHLENQVLKGVARGQNLMASAELVQCYMNEPPVVITPELTCAVCHKLIGEAIFACETKFGKRQIVHLHCRSEES
ncbi:hypothetical protein K493DRAFT_403612 [Basidiobolus meristosporus CBS 931.73]|uniref:CNH domain-containing protein n=1 Tax=Basidiobolus meristosporus CBS 931.73 TaxID=1314790 RepID=A0A1Y1ZC82_9FUNG|nr:hypothetical protein K493DRAFT_403612 [Basidiobolus meristosporus CBS 931.73]|eukprot:ORY07880.1 hypothetical protein K493DRAFT_403612 [Basidiobolus meristosporus CBS 931.73]